MGIPRKKNKKLIITTIIIAHWSTIVETCSYLCCKKKANWFPIETSSAVSTVFIVVLQTGKSLFNIYCRFILDPNLTSGHAIMYFCCIQRDFSPNASFSHYYYYTNMSYLYSCFLLLLWEAQAVEYCVIYRTTLGIKLVPLLKICNFFCLLFFHYFFQKVINVNVYEVECIFQKYLNTYTPPYARSQFIWHVFKLKYILMYNLFSNTLLSNSYYV